MDILVSNNAFYGFNIDYSFVYNILYKLRFACVSALHYKKIFF